VQEEGRDGVRDHGADGPEHLVAADLHSPGLQHVLELRGVLDLDLLDEDRLAGRDVVVLAPLPLLAGVLLLRATAAAVVNDRPGRLVARVRRR
jgi:hypothetical protein